MLNILSFPEHSYIQDYSLNKYSLFRKFFFHFSYKEGVYPLNILFPVHKEFKINLFALSIVVVSNEAR